MIIVLADFFAAIGYNIKAICDSNILYDSVATKGGDGLYTKLESKGSGVYYVLDGILGIIAGYLFVINNYIPMYICLFCVFVSIVLSLKFKDVYEPIKKKKSIKRFIDEYNQDITKAFKFIFKSNRMRSYIIFSALFFGIIKIMSIYQSTLLTQLRNRSRTVFNNNCFFNHNSINLC